MLGEIVLPSLATFGWMVAAAVAGAGFVLWPVLRRRFAEWRIARRKANGEDTSFAEWELEGYQPGAPSAEEMLSAPIRAAWAAAYMAVSTWVFFDLDPEIGQLLFTAATAFAALVLLLRDLRKTDHELGIQQMGDPMKGPPTLLDRYGKRVREVGATLVPLMLAGWIFLPDALKDQLPGWMLADSFAPFFILSIGLGVVVYWGWRWHNDPEEARELSFSEIALPREAVLGAVAAIAIVLVIVALAA